MFQFKNLVLNGNYRVCDYVKGNYFWHFFLIIFHFLSALVLCIAWGLNNSSILWLLLNKIEQKMFQREQKMFTNRKKRLTWKIATNWTKSRAFKVTKSLLYVLLAMCGLCMTFCGHSSFQIAFSRVNFTSYIIKSVSNSLCQP